MSEAAGGRRTPSEADVEAIRSVVRGYFDAWFDGDPEKMRAVLHPRLAKRRIAVADDTEGAEGIYEVSAAEMVGDAASGPKPGYSRDYEVRVIDIDREIATVIVDSVPFKEYVHVGRVGERWLVINTLYRRRYRD